MCIYVLSAFAVVYAKKESKSVAGMPMSVGATTINDVSGAVIAIIATLTICLASAPVSATSVNLIRTTCGGVIPLDSLYPIESYWSLRDLLDWRSGNDTSGVTAALTLGHSPDIAESVLGAMERLTGLSSPHVHIFQLDNLAGLSGCRVLWNPTDVLYISTIITSASVAILPYQGAGITCPLSVIATTTAAEGGGSTTVEFPVLSTAGALANITSSIQQTLIVKEGLTWPVSFQLQGGAMCSAYVVIAANRQVSLDDWWSWIPAVVYSAVVLPIALFSAFSHRKMGASTFAFMIGVVYIGYVGVSVGVMITIAGWQVSIGRMFPFPSSVTLYVALWAVYALVLPLLLFRHPCREMLANALVRSLIYGFFVGQLVAYWVLGFVALASVGLAVLCVTNGVLVFFYAQFVTLLATAKEVRTELRNMPMAWLAPVTPFVPPVLLYADLFFTQHASPRLRIMDPRLQEAVVLFNLQTALPFILLFESAAIALLVAATVRQPTFLVPLFMLLMLAGWYTIWTVQQYFSARTAWDALHAGGVISAPTPQWTLWPAIHSLIDRFNVDVYHARQQQQMLDEQQRLASGGTGAGGIQLFSSTGSGRSATSTATRRQLRLQSQQRQGPQMPSSTELPPSAASCEPIPQLPTAPFSKSHHQRNPSQQFSAPATSRSNSVQHHRSGSSQQHLQQQPVAVPQQVAAAGFPQPHHLTYNQVPQHSAQQLHMEQAPQEYWGGAVSEDNYDLHAQQPRPEMPYKQDRQPQPQYSPVRDGRDANAQAELVLESAAGNEFPQLAPTSRQSPPMRRQGVAAAPHQQPQRYYSGGAVVLEYDTPPADLHNQYLQNGRQVPRGRVPASGTPYDGSDVGGVQWHDDDGSYNNYH